MAAVCDRILELIRSGQMLEDDEFNALALELYAQQVERSPFLKAYVKAVAPPETSSWLELPGLPTAAFKRTQVCSFPVEETVTYFQTSGTTEGESGRHYFRSLEWYEAAILPNFRTHLLPEMRRMRMCILTPPPVEAPHSSLVHMMEVVRRELGTADSNYFLRNGKLQTEELQRSLLEAQDRGEAVFLLGTAFSLLFFLDALAPQDMRFRLPGGSRIMETGGFKGRTREVPRGKFYRMLAQALGVPEGNIVNEYGMTELSSQFYDESLLKAVPTVRKRVPPWCRVRVVDPLNGEILQDGERGLIRVWDLANVGSSLVLQTEDVGVTHGNTFEVHGRVPAAEPRGCSLGAEQTLST